MLEDFLKRKKLAADIFKTNPNLNIQNIHDHVAWVFQHIYSQPYIQTPDFTDIPRPVHGIQHVTRVALYTIVLGKLYQRYGCQEASELTQDDLHLLQIAALFHDSAREHDEEDEWDNDSALILYLYLTKVLNVSKQKAQLLAEAVANKDYQESNEPDNVYWKLEETLNGDIQFIATPSNQPKNIYQKIIHDADCLDILRAVDTYDGRYLDIFQQFCDENQTALEEIAELIAEARQLIQQQGDGRFSASMQVKLKYEKENAYALMLEDLNPKHYAIIYTLGKALPPLEKLTEIQLIDLQPYQPELGLTTENMQRALREGKIFSRSTMNPNYWRRKNNHSTPELGIDLELRKVMRIESIPTTSKKANSTLKCGNKNRSTSLLGYGSQPFLPYGFLIIDPNPSQIHDVFSKDADTGFSKTKVSGHYYSKTTIDDLRFEQKYGFIHSVNNEVVMDINRYDAIYYTHDGAYHRTGLKSRVHPFLMALYLQQKYQLFYQETKQRYISELGDQGLNIFINRFGDQDTLPIFEYKSNHKIIHISPKLINDENIIMFWVEGNMDKSFHVAQGIFFSDYFIGNKLKDIHDNHLLSTTQEATEAETLDKYYPENLKKRIEHGIKHKKLMMLLNLYQYKFNNLFTLPELLEKIRSSKSIDINELINFINSENLTQTDQNYPIKASYYHVILKLAIDLFETPSTQKTLVTALEIAFNKVKKYLSSLKNNKPETSEERGWIAFALNFLVNTDLCSKDELEDLILSTNLTSKDFDCIETLRQFSCLASTYFQKFEGDSSCSVGKIFSDALIHHLHIGILQPNNQFLSEFFTFNFDPDNKTISNSHKKNLIAKFNALVTKEALPFIKGTPSEHIINIINVYHYLVTDDYPHDIATILLSELVKRSDVTTRYYINALNNDILENEYYSESHYYDSAEFGAENFVNAAKATLALLEKLKLEHELELQKQRTLARSSTAISIKTARTVLFNFTRNTQAIENPPQRVVKPI